MLTFSGAKPSSKGCFPLAPDSVSDGSVLCSLMAPAQGAAVLGIFSTSRAGSPCFPQLHAHPLAPYIYIYLVPEEDTQEAQCFCSAAWPVKYKIKLGSLELNPWFPFPSLLGSSACTALLRGLLGRGRQGMHSPCWEAPYAEWCSMGGGNGPMTLPVPVWGRAPGWGWSRRALHCYR